MRLLLSAVLLLALGAPRPAAAQVDEDQLGAWYMYFLDGTPGEGPWGFQGDVQYRNWDLGGDLEQLLLRGGGTWTSSDGDVTFTLGYGNITSGEFGDGSATSGENRVYQEMLLRQPVGPRISLRHRFRYEQRWVEGQDFRTRYRYALFVTVPLTNRSVQPGTIYLSLYDEIFVNGQRDIGDGRRVELFDRNRLYGALGYGLSNGLRIQGGYMLQTTHAYTKGQLQLSLHHRI